MKVTAKIALAAPLLFLPTPASAQITPPAPGVEMPQAYYDRIVSDPAAFQFQKAWIQKLERVKAARRQFEAARSQGPDLAPDYAAPPGEAVMTGTVRVPVIMIKYRNTGADPYPTTDLDTRLFSGPSGTMTQLYNEMSYGNVTLTGDVWGWVEASSNDNFYEGPPGCNGLCGSAKTGKLILEALQGVDATVNFGQYDNDGPDGLPNSGDDDGFVDFIAIVQPEVGGECGTTNIWSHRWVVGGWSEFPGPWNSNDPRNGGGFIQVWDYTIQPALGSASGCGTNMVEIGVFAHEFGHAFGLPDLYDTDGGGEGIGNFGLMGSGNWLLPNNPTHMCAWSKMELGWLTPIDVGPVRQNYAVVAVETTPQVYKLDIVEEKFSRKTFTPLDGTASLHCGLATFPANNRNWVSGAGYGNNWNEALRHDFGYDGSDPVTLQYDVSWDTEVTYDFGFVKIEVNNVVSTVASYDGTGSATGVIIDLTPFLSGSGAGSYRIIAQFTSDLLVSDEDGGAGIVAFNSGSGGPFKLDNISVTGGGESYFSGFELLEDGWYYDFNENPTKEFFLAENRNSVVGLFDQNIWQDGLYIWHIEQTVNDNTSGSSGVSILRPAKVELMPADGANELLLGIDRGDRADAYPGTSGNRNLNDASNPSSKSHNGFATNVVVQVFGGAGSTMNVDMQAGRFAPTVTAITPSVGDNNQVIAINDLAGIWFYNGGTFCLRDGTTDYPASNVGWVGKTKATGSLDLNGISAGTYDVVWKGPDGQEGTLTAGFTVDDVVTGIGDIPLTPVNRLEQNHPNPFNPTTTIRYSIKERGHVTLRVYNVAGQLTRTLVNEMQSPSRNGFAVVWDGRNDAGGQVASGVYFYNLTAAGGFQEVRKLVLLK